MRLPTTPIGSLMTEHRVIQRAVADMKRHVDLIESDRQLDPAYIDVIVDFMRTYADRCHHGKEEDILFARLRDKPLTPEHANVMEGLIADHQFSRDTTAQLVAATRRYRDGDQGGLDEIRRGMEALIALYPRHIETEDHSFFKPAIEYFTQEERAEMAQEFADFDRTMIHERYREVMDALESDRIPQLV